MMQRADTIGVFQIESRAQQSMLPRLKPTCFYDIVMQVAIIRPGPIQGQMIHPFLRRRSGMEPVTYPHPKLKSVLERTLGVPLFQEQGMRMAIEAAGFSPGEADQLRRAMGHKRSRERMEEIHAKLVDGMVANGIDRDAAEQLFHMLEGFADYGFPESHAASFALLAYASAYVKCHLPAIFAAAILNVQPMGFYSTEVLVNDARRHGVDVKPIEVNASEYWSHVESRRCAALGLSPRARPWRGAAQALGRGPRARSFRRRAGLRARTQTRERSARESCDRRRFRTVVCVAPRGDVGAARARRARSARRARRAHGRRRAARRVRNAAAEKTRRIRSLVDRRHAVGQVMEHFRALSIAQRVLPAASQLPKRARAIASAASAAS